MKKKRNAGEKGTKWQHSGMKSKNWNERELKEIVAAGGYAQSTRVNGAGTHVTRNRGEGLQRKEVKRSKYQGGLWKR